MAKVNYLTITDEQIFDVKLRAIDLEAWTFSRVCDHAMDRSTGTKLFHNDVARARVAEFINTNGRRFDDAEFRHLPEGRKIRLMELVNY